MILRWLFFLVGILIHRDSLAFSPIPDLENEWATFAETLRDPAYRLPTTTKPVRYEVSLTPYFDVAPSAERQFTFDGIVTIWIEATQANVNEIILHCNDLTIGSANVSSADDLTNNILVEEDERVCEAPYSFLRLRTSQTLQLNQEYVITINFIGNFQTNMRGFYRSFYRDSTGRRWMGTTQFQPGHARQAFPCYDEPGFKSYFDITIIRPDDFSPTISNMPIRVTENLTETNQVSETFHTTPYTSTYLLAIIVSHYEIIAAGNNTERPFEIYARDNAVGKGDWALEIGEDLLVAMEQLTNISYYDMQTNLDMKQAAIPDFSANAMENWGLLTYREAVILYDELNSNHFYRQRVANIISHEIAHMWFGNLVTCAWWDNLWLNEGFARFYQYYLTGFVREELGYATRFIVEQLHMAMFDDSVDSAHPLTDPTVNDPTSVSAHFSSITYAKGACILRMTQHLLGEETYNNGLRLYLSERKFDVAEPEHLFSALDRAAAADNALAAYSGITIDEYFRTWSEKSGFPMVHVSVAHRSGNIHIAQLLWNRDTGVSAANTELWHIPVTWTRGNAPNFDNLKPSHILTDQISMINRGSIGLEWVIFNIQQTGFYRVNYDETTWALITRALRDDTERTVIHEYNRAQIVNDVFSFARAGFRRYERAYNILSFLEFEDQYAPWLAAIDGFAFVRRRLAHDVDNLQKLHQLIIQWSTAAVNRLGYDEIANESYMDGLFRMYLMEFLCNVGHTGCVNAAREKFADWRNGETIPANLRPWVYCTGLRTGDAEDFNYFWQRYQNEDLASEQVVMLQSAGCTSDTASLERFLSAIVADSDDVRPQDYSTAYSNAVSGNEYNTIRVFNWLTNNFEAANNAFGSLLTPLINIAERLLNDDDFDVFTRWVDQNQAFMGESVYNSTIFSIQAARANLEWSDRRIPELAQYFETGYVEDIIEEVIITTEPPTDEPTEEGTSAAPTTEDDGEVIITTEPPTDEPTEEGTTAAPTTEDDGEVIITTEPPTDEPTEEGTTAAPTTEDDGEVIITTEPPTDEPTEEGTTAAPTTEDDGEDDGEPDSANITVLSAVTLTVTLMINFLM